MPQRDRVPIFGIFLIVAALVLLVLGIVGSLEETEGAKKVESDSESSLAEFVVANYLFLLGFCFLHLTILVSIWLSLISIGRSLMRLADRGEGKSS